MVRRRTRKDPGQFNRRAGLRACVLISLLAVTSLSSPLLQAAPSQGPASKTTGVEPAESETKPVHFNLNFLPWRKSSATRQSVESTVAKAMPAPKSAPVPAAPKGSSYLPAGGALPLRFASARTWPDRMSPSDEAALSLALAPDPDLGILSNTALAENPADGSSVPTTAGVGGPGANGPMGGSVTITASSADAAVDREPQLMYRPYLYGSGDALLTADLVLNSLDNMSNDRGSVPGQFRPAVPAHRSVDSVPMAVAP